MAFYPTWQADPSQGWQNQFIQQIPQNTSSISALNSIDFQPQVSIVYSHLLTSHIHSFDLEREEEKIESNRNQNYKNNFFFLQYTELRCISTEWLCSRWSWFRSKLWPIICHTSATLRFPRQSNSANQSSITAKC